MKSSSCALVALVLALIIGGAYYFYSQKNTEQNKEINSSTSTTDNQSDNETTDLSVLEPEKAELLAVTDDGHGLANRIYSDKQFIHTITAQLPDLNENKFYNGWLGQIVGDKEIYINTGKLEANGEDYYLEYRDVRDLSDYRHIIVSIENAEVTEPTTKVLEGNFK